MHASPHQCHWNSMEAQGENPGGLVISETGVAQGQWVCLLLFQGAF